MGDMGDVFRAMKEDQKERKAERNAKFARECFEAGQLAAKHDMFLKCLNQENYHYRLMLPSGNSVDFWGTGRYVFHGNLNMIKDKACRNAFLNGPMATVKFIIEQQGGEDEP